MASTYTTNSLSLLNGDMILLQADADVDNKIATQTITLLPSSVNPNENYVITSASARMKACYRDNVTRSSASSYYSTYGQESSLIFTGRTSDGKIIKREITFADRGQITLRDPQALNPSTSEYGVNLWILNPGGGTSFIPTSPQAASTAVYTPQYTQSQSSTYVYTDSK